MIDNKYTAIKGRNVLRTVAVGKTAKKFDISERYVRKILKGERGSGKPMEALQIVNFYNEIFTTLSKKWQNAIK